MSNCLPLFLVLIAAAPVAAQEQLFADLGTCDLESGAVLEECRIGYRTIGELAPDGGNAVLVPTWYGGNTSNVPSLAGPRIPPGS